MNNQPPNTSLPSTSSSARPETLIVVLDAYMYSKVGMPELIAHILRELHHIPGVTDVLALGIDPIRKGKATLPNGKQLQLSVFNADDSRAVLFEHEGVMYLYSEGPVENPLHDFYNCGSNTFVDLLCDVLETYRPVHVNVETFRHLIYNDRLQGAIMANVDVLTCGDILIPLNTPARILLWDYVAITAARECIQMD